MSRFHIVVMACAFLGLSACSDEQTENIVVATPFAITIETTGFGEPVEQAKAHCATHGRVVKSRGGIKVGEPSWKTLWGYDCVDP